MTARICINGEVDDAIVIEGTARLRAGGSAEDVAEWVAQQVEDDPNDRTVGFNGFPNVAGQVELDASFMEGAERKVGAVAAIVGVRHPISAARAVMERLPHVLLVGEGANRFAREIGLEQRDNLTEQSRGDWLRRLAETGRDEAAAMVLATDPAAPLIGAAQDAFRYDDGHDTMNVLVRDAEGHMVVAITTAGVAWKYPGRAGDSPVIGAGSYVDDRFGAAACMGLGEVAIRVAAASRVVFAMGAGRSALDIGTEVVREAFPMLGRRGWLRVLTMRPDGEVMAIASHPGLTFKTQTVDEDAPTTRDAVVV